MINVNRIVNSSCKHADCFKPAVYEFTDRRDGFDRTITIGYSCEHHVEEVNDMLMKIYRKGEKDDGS